MILKKTRLFSFKGYGADIIRLPDGRSEPIFVTYENDFKPFLEMVLDLGKNLGPKFEIIFISHMSQILVRTSHPAT